MDPYLLLSLKTLEILQAYFLYLPERSTDICCQTGTYFMCDYGQNETIFPRQMVEIALLISRGVCGVDVWITSPSLQFPSPLLVAALILMGVIPKQVRN